jgi:hypothetical protein
VPELNFKGKEFVYNHHLTVPFRPLLPQGDKGIAGQAKPMTVCDCNRGATAYVR